jgi:methylated-DNA-[protein]-cysteine S-methyltransferase
LDKIQDLLFGARVSSMTSALVVDSLIGPLRLESADGGALSAIRFDGRAELGDPLPEAAAPILLETASQLAAYFAGERHTFDLPLAPAGTDFQRSVWRELARIPYGTTVTYGELAARLGLAVAASRAVGSANGANPIPIVLPCHRVIGADGTLTGYAGGLARKQALLHLEGVSTERDQLELF